MNESAVLLLHSADRKGLVATIANFLFAHGGNILHACQHQDAELGLLPATARDRTDFSRSRPWLTRPWYLIRPRAQDH
jgi:formyltetrahydrofolate hydrolase